jgi:hypothetical protein
VDSGERADVAPDINNHVAQFCDYWSILPQCSTNLRHCSPAMHNQQFCIMRKQVIVINTDLCDYFTADKDKYKKEKGK